MKVIFCFLVIGLCLLAGSASADSIKVGGVLHKDVYIITKPQYYLVHFPEEGRVEKVSRARRDVEAPVIDSDATHREALRARYDARRSEVEGALKPVPDEAVALDTEAFLQKVALVERVIFDTQFDHWRGLSEVQQDGILREILNLSANKEAKWAGEQSTIQSRLGGLDAAKAKRETELTKVEGRHKEAIEDAERRNSTDFYLRLHERELVEYTRGNSSHVSDYWLRGADTEQALEARRKAKANQTYGKEVEAQKAALSKVESAITKQKRDVLLVENKRKEAALRYGAYLARIDGLILASQAGYEPGQKFNVLETWEADGDKKTPTVVVESSLWRLHCERADFGLDGDFAITVYDAETDTPFTRIADKDFLKMRSRIFERSGRYYFVVKQDSNRIPYELTVSTVAEE